MVNNIRITNHQDELEKSKLLNFLKSDIEPCIPPAESNVISNYCLA